MYSARLCSALVLVASTCQAWDADWATMETKKLMKRVYISNLVEAVNERCEATIYAWGVSTNAVVTTNVPPTTNYFVVTNASYYVPPLVYTDSRVSVTGELVTVTNVTWSSSGVTNTLTVTNRVQLLGTNILTNAAIAALDPDFLEAIDAKIYALIPEYIQSEDALGHSYADHLRPTNGVGALQYSIPAWSKTQLFERLSVGVIITNLLYETNGVILATNRNAEFKSIPARRRSHVLAELYAVETVLTVVGTGVAASVAGAYTWESVTNWHLQGWRRDATNRIYLGNFFPDPHALTYYEWIIGSGSVLDDYFSFFPGFWPQDGNPYYGFSFFDTAEVFGNTNTNITATTSMLFAPKAGLPMRIREGDPVVPSVKISWREVTNETLEADLYLQGKVWKNATLHSTQEVVSINASPDTNSIAYESCALPFEQITNGWLHGTVSTNLASISVGYTGVTFVSHGGQAVQITGEMLKERYTILNALTHRGFVPMAQRFSGSAGGTTLSGCMSPPIDTNLCDNVLSVARPARALETNLSVGVGQERYETEYAVQYEQDSFQHIYITRTDENACSMKPVFPVASSSNSASYTFYGENLPLGVSTNCVPQGPYINGRTNGLFEVSSGSGSGSTIVGNPGYYVVGDDEWEPGADIAGLLNTSLGLSSCLNEGDPEACEIDAAPCINENLCRRIGCGTSIENEPGATYLVAEPSFVHHD